MLDIQLIRKQLPLVLEGLRRRRMGALAEEVSARLGDLDARFRANQTQLDGLREARNKASQEIGRVKKAGGDATALLEEQRGAGDGIKQLEAAQTAVEEERTEILMRIPNLLDASVPDGDDEDGNVEVRRVGEIPAFAFEPKSHVDLGEALGILEFERAAKLAGARFVVLKGAGARLERALMNYMLDLHTSQHGYTEVAPPAIANRATLTANGNLPKFEEDLFALAGSDYFLIPTAEVPLTNLHRGEILDAAALPMYLTAHTPCFRSEAGSAGRDTRGMIRVHQFHKVELVKLVPPATSFDELEGMVGNAEAVLKGLGLPYRVVALCSGDVGFNAAKTYDIEVWLPSQGKYREISSCSNCTDFQARRGATRFRDAEGKLHHPHTLNGSGLPTGRTLVAILENCQRADGSIRIPEALRPYMGGLEVIGHG